MGQDPTRAPRVDTAVFPAGTCADISFVRLPEPASSFVGANSSYNSIRNDLAAMGFGNIFKRYLVYFDGPSVQQDVCGDGVGDFSEGPSYAVLWLAGCPGIPTDATAAHELLHALGALPPGSGAPNVCPGDDAHPCDSTQDVLYPYASGTPLSQLVLDYNHDDYYAHSGSWVDIQDSLWLHLLAAPIVPLALTVAGEGAVASVVPGLACASSCTTQWDGGTQTALIEEPAVGRRFVGWSGACTGRAACSVTLTGPVDVLATFGPVRVPVALAKTGKGAITCVPRCGKTFAAGSSLTLRAVAAKGWKFAAWTGDCAKARIATCRPKTDFHVRARAIFRRR